MRVALLMVLAIVVGLGTGLVTGFLSVFLALNVGSQLYQESGFPSSPPVAVPATPVQPETQSSGLPAGDP